MYVAKVAGFSPYNYLGRLAASCIQPCDGMPDLGPSFNEQEVIQVLTTWLLFQSRLQLPPFEVGGLIVCTNLMPCASRDSVDSKLKLRRQDDMRKQMKG